MGTGCRGFPPGVNLPAGLGPRNPCCNMTTFSGLGSSVSLCSGPFRGASGAQQVARLHRKGPHRLEAWRSGSLSKSRILRAVYRSSQHTDANPQAKSPQVFYSHRCSIPKGVLFQSCTFGGLGGLGLGAGCSWARWAWWCSRGCQKLCGLVRKPVAALHNAAAEPLRHASN